MDDAPMNTTTLRSGPPRRAASITTRTLFRIMFGIAR
jgi:hypothetical protein